MRTTPLGEQKREPAAHWEVVCEGLSELIYIDQLGGKIHGTTYKAYNAKGGDPTNIQQETKKRFRRGQTIVIMDVDNNDIEEIRRFREWCEKKKIKLLISNPSFEVWLLMHYQNVSTNTDQYGLEHALGRYVTRGRYEKGKGIRVNKALIDGAVERAQKRIPDDVDVFEYVLTNPGTTMVHLLDGLIHDGDRSRRIQARCAVTSPRIHALPYACRRIVRDRIPMGGSCILF